MLPYAYGFTDKGGERISCIYCICFGAWVIITPSPIQFSRGDTGKTNAQALLAPNYGYLARTGVWPNAE